MSRFKSQEELNHLVALISEHHDGISIDALLLALGDSLQRRSLQRRLSMLVRQGRIQMMGEARSVRYRRTPCVTDAFVEEKVTAISATTEAIRNRTPSAVNKEDQAHFIELVLGEFKTLHPGNVVRFGIRPLEFSVWHEKHNNQGA